MDRVGLSVERVVSSDSASVVFETDLFTISVDNALSTDSDVIDSAEGCIEESVANAASFVGVAATLVEIEPPTVCERVSLVEDWEAESIALMILSSTTAVVLIVLRVVDAGVISSTIGSVSVDEMLGRPTVLAVDSDGASTLSVIVLLSIAANGTPVERAVIDISSDELRDVAGNGVFAWPIERTASSAEFVVSVERGTAAPTVVVFAPSVLSLVSTALSTVAADENSSPTEPARELLVPPSTIVSTILLVAPAVDCEFVTLFSVEICVSVIVLCSAVIERVVASVPVVIAVVLFDCDRALVVSTEGVVAAVDTVVEGLSAETEETANSSIVETADTIDAGSSLLDVEMLSVTEVALLVRDTVSITLVLLVAVCVFI